MLHEYKIFITVVEINFITVAINHFVSIFSIRMILVEMLTYRKSINIWEDNRRYLCQTYIEVADRKAKGKALAI